MRVSWGRLTGAVAAFAAVAGCTAVAVAMSRTQPTPDAAATTLPSRSASYPRYAPVPTYPATTSASATSVSVTPSRTTTSATHHVAAPPRSRSPRPAPGPTTAAPRRGGALPLPYSTGDATRVITVTASSYGSTTAWLQPWVKAAGGGWIAYGSGITAHVGSDGLTTSPSEFRSATPIGSFTLTQAFGALADPGTGLSYFQTTPADWWISTAGPQYNTHQRCSTCGYASPDEQLYYETPFYNYAVVINTPSGSSAYPHGSAFFLHVTDGQPTAGCVAIPQWRLVQIMQWLTPAAHPRILIGVT